MSNHESFTKQCLSFLGLMLALLAISILVIWSLGNHDVRAEEAEALYRKGESASTLYEKNSAFNEALALLLKLEEKYDPRFGTGKLPYNIGNTYFQLGAYPLAILYYKRAENLMPRSTLIKKNLSLAREKSGVQEKKSSFLNLMLLKNIFSLPEKLQLLFASSLLTLFFFSMRIWKKNAWLLQSGAFFLTISAFVLVNLGVSHYFTPIEAVLIHAVELRRDAGMEFAKATDQPILGGTLVEVIGTSVDARWLKIVIDGKAFGYVPYESIRLVFD